ncbi:MAG: aspartate/glutamate racemase family protein [Burkholderiales bacterium]|nr:aspartate/glutamate racemase family protein [Burkholderiales bacterium]
MKLLLVNGNRTRAVTAAVLAEAQATAADGTELVAVEAAFGADIVFSHAENAVATHAVLDALARHAGGCDAAILAISFDSGLAAARELLPMPVLGITEAALLTACQLARRVGVVTVGRVSSSLYAEVFAQTGLGDRIAAVGTVDMASAGEYLSPQDFDARVVAEANRLAAEAGAEAVVACGAALAGIARRARAAVAVPLVDGVGAAVRQAEALVRGGYRARARPAGPRATMAGVSAELAALFARP